MPDGFREDELAAYGPVVRYARDRLGHADREEWALGRLAGLLREG